MREAPDDLEAIEAALRATDAVGGVVQAVWALSRAPLPRLDETVHDALAYYDEVDEVIDVLVGPPRIAAADEVLRVVIGPERSFCGVLPVRVRDQIPADGAPLGIVGTRLADALGRRPSLRARQRFVIPAPGSVDDLGDAAERLCSAVLAAAEDRAVTVHHATGDGARLRGAVLLATRAPRDQPPVDRFSPLEVLVRDALHEAMTGRLYVALADALRTEVRWRVAATERARRAIEERKNLLDVARRVRAQERVTRELGELVAGLLGVD
ncbi:MAG: F0F1 ATP synthase subunit gamma [Sandaracinaceae bacterium]